MYICSEQIYANGVPRTVGKDGRDLELRFKCFAVDGKERSVILCFHGLSRGEKSG